MGRRALPRTGRSYHATISGSQIAPAIRVPAAALRLHRLASHGPDQRSGSIVKAPSRPADLICRSPLSLQSSDFRSQHLGCRFEVLLPSRTKPVSGGVDVAQLFVADHEIGRALWVHQAFPDLDRATEGLETGTSFSVRSAGSKMAACVWWFSPPLLSSRSFIYSSCPCSHYGSPRGTVSAGPVGPRTWANLLRLPGQPHRRQTKARVVGLRDRVPSQSGTPTLSHTPG